MKDAPASSARGPNLRWLRSKPTGVSRLAFRLPIYLYRLDLGCLLLVHRGRQSGMLHETVLEVLLHDPATRESVVLPAWGEKADWYRNVGATPALEIRTGGQRYVPEQRFLAPEEKIAEGESNPIDESGEQTYAFCFRCLSEDRKPCQQ